MFLVRRKKGNGGKEMMDQPALHAVHTKTVSTQSDLGQEEKNYLCERGEINIFFAVFFFNFLLKEDILFLLNTSILGVLISQSIIYNFFYILTMKQVVSCVLIASGKESSRTENKTILKISP